MAEPLPVLDEQPLPIDGRRPSSPRARPAWKEVLCWRERHPEDAERVHEACRSVVSESVCWCGRPSPGPALGSIDPRGRVERPIARDARDFTRRRRPAPVLKDPGSEAPGEPALVGAGGRGGPSVTRGIPGGDTAN